MAKENQKSEAPDARSILREIEGRVLNAHAQADTLRAALEGDAPRSESADNRAAVADLLSEDLLEILNFIDQNERKLRDN